MKKKEILVFGASGFIGTNIIRKLTKNNHKVTAVTRNVHQKGIRIKTQGNFGYLNVIEANIFDIDKLKLIINSAEICINLVGILHENGKNTFNNIHNNFPSVLSKICKEKNVEQFIHISALGIDQASEKSKYAKSKLEGEKKIIENFPKATILRPSVVYGNEDNFTNLFMSLLSKFPIFPLYYNGKTKFTPIHVSDLTDIIFHIIDKKIESEIIECIGRETINLKNIITKLSESIEKKRLLMPMPLLIGKMTAKLFETIMTKPLLTIDQIRLLNYDNIPSGKHKTNFDFNMKAKRIFELEINKYSYMYKNQGEYSKKNLSSKL